jgi:hypothetical protein
MYKLHIVQISTVYHFEKEPFWDDNSGFTCCAWCPLVFGKTHSTAPHITSLWKLVYHTIAKIKDIDYIYAHCVLLFCVVLLCCCAEHSDVHTHNHTHTCIQPYIHIAIRPHHPLQWQVSHGRFGVHRDRWRARLQGTQPTCPGVSENRVPLTWKVEWGNMGKLNINHWNWRYIFRQHQVNGGSPGSLAIKQQEFNMI